MKHKMASNCQKKNVLIGLQDMYRTPWLWQWGKLHLPISFYTRRICVLQGNIGRQCWGLFLLTSPEHAFVFVCSFTSCICLCFLYMAHEDKTSILDDHVNYVLICISSFPFIMFPPCFCGSHLFHRSQHCPMGIVAINPAKQKYRL